MLSRARRRGRVRKTCSTAAADYYSCWRYYRKVDYRGPWVGGRAQAESFRILTSTTRSSTRSSTSTSRPARRRVVQV